MLSQWGNDCFWPTSAIQATCLTMTADDPKRPFNDPTKFKRHNAGANVIILLVFSN